MIGPEIYTQRERECVWGSARARESCKIQAYDYWRREAHEWPSMHGPMNACMSALLMHVCLGMCMRKYVIYVCACRNKYYVLYMHMCAWILISVICLCIACMCMHVLHTYLYLRCTIRTFLFEYVSIIRVW